MILGTIVLNLGVWGVVTPLEPIAHMIIYVGATPSMLAALMLVIFGWDKLIRAGHGGHPETELLPETRRPGARSPEVWPALADGLHELHRQRHRHLHGGPAGRDLPRLAGARGAHRADRSLACPLRHHRHHHPAVLRRHDRPERENPQALRLVDHHLLRHRLRLRHHLRDEAPVRRRSRAAAAGQHGHAHHGHRAGMPFS